MPLNDCSHEDRPYKNRGASEDPNQNARHEWRNKVIVINPHEFRVRTEVSNFRVVSGRAVLLAMHPSHIGPEVSLHGGGMNVILQVSVAVMMPMMRCPPQWSPLNCQRSRYSQQELESSAGFESAMGKISGVAG